MRDKPPHKPTTAVALLAALLAFGLSATTGAGDPAPPSNSETATAATRGPDPAATIASLPSQFSLSEESQEYLWDVEHLAFVMGQDLGPVFKLAIREGDGNRLLGFLAEDFRARLFAGEGRSIRKGPVTLTKWDAGDRLEEIDREAFVETLRSWGRELSRIDGVVFHTYYISPDVRGDLAGGWETRWDVTISGVRGDGTRAVRRFDCAFHFARLTKQMGSEKGWIEGFELLRVRNTESPRALLEDVTAQTGIDVEALSDNWDLPGPPYPMVPGFSRMFDLDRDGRVDLLAADTHFLMLYRGLGNGRFEDVTAGAGLDGVARLPANTWLTGALVADLDNDGYEDLLFSVEQQTAAGRAHAVALFRNRGDRSFEIVPETVHNLGRRYKLLPKGLAAADYDGDGLVDLFLGAVGREPAPEDRIAKWIGDRSHREGVLVRNLGGFRFEDVSAAAGLVGERPDIAAATWLDLEPDGDADLFLSNHIGVNVLWENRGRGAAGNVTFVKRRQPPGYGGFSMGATAGDLDGDGDPDLYVANMYTSAGARIIDNLTPEDYPEGAYELIRGFATGNELYRNHGDGTIEATGVAAEVANGGWAYGPELVDFDGDGALDIYSPAGFQSVERGKPDG